MKDRIDHGMLCAERLHMRFNLLWQRLLFAFAMLFCGIAGADELPDLLLWKPNDWPAAVYTAGEAGTKMAKTVFTRGTPIYFNAFCGNGGNGVPGVDFDILWEILDSSKVVVANLLCSLTGDDPAKTTPNRFFYWGDYSWISTDSLPVGSYTYRMTMDSGNTVVESDESNNVAEFAFRITDNPVYRISLNANGGTLSESTVWREENEEMGVLPVPTKKWYSFAGWFTEMESGNLVRDDALVTSDTTVYAHWDIGEIPDAEKPDLGFQKASGWSDSLYLSNAKTDESTYVGTPMNEFANGETIYLNFMYADTKNSGYSAVFDDNFSIKYRVLDGGGNEVAVSMEEGCKVPNSNAAQPVLNRTPDCLKNLLSGVYVLEITLDTENGIAEFDETNNTESYSFRVMPGDAIFTIDENQTLTDVKPNGNTSIIVPDSVTTIAYGAFSGLSSITNVVIPNSVTRIGRCAFANCTGLVEITIPDSVTDIGEGALYGCENLQFLTIPFVRAGDTFKTGVRLSDGSSLQNRYIISVTASRSGLELLLFTKVSREWEPSGHLTVTDGWFTHTYSYEGYDRYSLDGGIPQSLRSVTVTHTETIDNSAFNGCSQLTNVTMSEGVEIIGESAFYGCAGLTNITIPASVTNVGYYAFHECTALRYATIAEGAVVVPSSAFTGCKSLTLVVIPDSVTSIGAEAFYGCRGLTNVMIGVAVKHIGDSAFYDCSGLTSVMIGDSVTDIGHRAFYGCVGLTNVMFGANVAGIGNSAFSGCNGLTNVALPAGLTSIGDSVFSGCSSLTSVMIQDGVMSIGNRAFFGCAALPSIILPRALDAIQSCAFGECASLRTVYFQGALAPYVADDIYKDASPALVSYVPTDSTGWEDGTSKLPRLWPVDGTELGRRIVNGEPPRPTVWTVTFDARDGVIDEATRAVTNGCAVGALPSATREGYDFDGWFTAADGGSQLSAGAIVTESVTYYAHWTEIPLPPEPIPVPEPSPGAKGFGPGYGSKFAISASDEAHVVGVHGLTWEDFPVREYDGYHVFSDSRIVDRDKGSGADAADHQWCGVYADMVTCVWSGWSQYAGFTDEDAFGRFLVEEEKDDVFGYVAQCAGKDMEPYKNTIKTDATFPQSLATSFESADRLMSTVVCFDNYNWYGSYRELIVHAVVCCGYSLDTAKPLTDPTCLKGLFIIDPDNDRENGGGGAAAPDTITYCPVTWNATTSRYEIENIFGATGYFSDEQYPSITLRTEVSRISRWSEESQPPPTLDVWTVTFDAQGGVVSESTRAVTNGCAVGTLPELARARHKLDGWFTAASGGEAVSSATVITTNVTFYAHWTATGEDDDPTPLPAPNVWTVTFDAQGGVVSESTRAVTNGCAVGTLPETAREDHKLDGWFTAVSGGEAVSSAAVITTNVTFYAHWTKVVVPEPVTPEPVTPEPVTPEPVTPDPVTPDPTPVVEEEIYGGKVENITFSKAQTVLGVLYDAEDNLAGTVEVKFGKINAKKQTVKVSGSATLMMDGKAKKITAKAVNVTVDATKRVPPTTLAFKAPIGNMAFAMDADGVFTLKSDKYEMVGMRTRQSATLPVSVGGAMPNGTVYFNMEMDDLPVFGKDGSLISAALPSDVPIRVSGNKWLFEKTPSLKYAKDKTTGKYRLVGLGESSKPNVSGLKLTYTAKTGVFKGTFKLYTTTGGDKPKLKKFTVNVIGFVVDGVGYGTATLKKPAGGPWTVTVE